MKVTIITACYNRAGSVRDAIQSVLAQDYKDIEYIIVDGASTDGSQEVIANAIKEAPENVCVKYISEPDGGMYEAINKGIRMATGDVIGLCHSDDMIFAPDIVSWVVRKLELSKADMLYADGLYIDANNMVRIHRRWIGGKYTQWKVRHGWLPLHTTCYIRKALYDRLGLYDEQYKIAADTDLLVRYLKRKDVKVAYLHEFVTRMRMGGMSTDNAKRKMMWKEDINVFRRHGFRHLTMTKVEKMAWKVPQFISAKLWGGKK